MRMRSWKWHGACGHPLFTVGEGGDDLALVGIRHDGFEQVLSLETPDGPREVRLPLAGRFQVSNALIAAGLAICAGVERDVALSALEYLEGASGRLERVGETDDGALVFVDYAHKPDALDTALAALRPFTRGRLVVVFGAGGDRDKGKRPLMGEAACRQADVVIVTDDNPRGEDPAEIRAEILAAAPGALEVPDRHAAIEAAVGMLQDGDVLCIAGKGHETGQIVGDQVLPFSDQDAARAAIASAAEAALFAAASEDSDGLGLDLDLAGAIGEELRDPAEPTFAADTSRDGIAGEEAEHALADGDDFETLLGELVMEGREAAGSGEEAEHELFENEPDLAAEDSEAEVSEQDAPKGEPDDRSDEEGEDALDMLLDDIARETSPFAPENDTAGGDEGAAAADEVAEAGVLPESRSASASFVSLSEDDLLGDFSADHKDAAGESLELVEAGEPSEPTEPDVFEADLLALHAESENEPEQALAQGAIEQPASEAEALDEDMPSPAEVPAPDEPAKEEVAFDPESLVTTGGSPFVAAAAAAAATGLGASVVEAQESEADEIDPDRPLWTLAEMVEATGGRGGQL